MRALTYAAFGGPLSVTDVPDPVAPPGGAVVRVEASGLCRSDWHGWLGHDTDIVGFPHIPGHEFAGTVAALGGTAAGGGSTGVRSCGSLLRHHAVLPLS